MSRFAHNDPRQRFATQRITVQLERPFDVTAVKTAAYSAQFGELVRCDPTAGAFTVTLPSAVDQPGRYLAIKNASASTNTITVDGAGSETIDGSATADITTGYWGFILISDGANWLSI